MQLNRYLVQVVVIIALQLVPDIVFVRLVSWV